MRTSNITRNVIQFDKLKMIPTDEMLKEEKISAPGSEIPPQVKELIEEARSLYLEHADPKGVMADISIDEFSGIFDSSGLNDSDPVLENIYPEADHLSLFVLTSGPDVCKKIEWLSQNDDMAAGYMLDIITSLATDNLVSEIETLIQKNKQTEYGDDLRTLSYSPGYCGWHLSVQKPLFDYLRPEDIGVTLSDSFLMSPLKTVSGVLVSGYKNMHYFSECSFEYCKECATISCRERMDDL